MHLLKYLLLLIHVSKLQHLKLSKPWKEQVLAKVKEKIAGLKQKTKPKETSTK